MSGISVNQDDTHFFYTRAPDEMSEAGVDAVLDPYVGTEVRELLFCVNAGKASFPSQAWPTLWAGYDPDGGDDQPFLAALPPRQRASFRPIFHNLALLERRGIDPFARWLARARKLGISPWLSMRMNDLHHIQMPLEERRKKLALEQPPRYRAPHRPNVRMQDGAADFSQPEIYDHRMSLVRELAGRYDMDGLELDFSRHFAYLRPGREIEDQPVMTRFVREAREILDAAARERGHAVRLGVRVPAAERTARWIGLDPVLWARQGLVDFVVPTPVWYTIDFAMPVWEWKRLLEGTGALLGAGLDRHVHPFPGGVREQPACPEHVRGAAASYLNQGADRVYLFDYFDRPTPQLGPSILAEENLLRTVGSPESLAPHPRRHLVTYQDVLGPGECPAQPLPLRPRHAYAGAPCFGELRIDTGPKPPRGAVLVLLAFAESAPEPPADLEVFVNGVRAAAKGRTLLPPPLPAAPLYGFEPPLQALNDGINLVELLSHAQAWEVHWAEIRLIPG
jgi:hypothetical protein